MPCTYYVFQKKTEKTSIIRDLELGKKGDWEHMDSLK
jgi:hypothetical protein